MKNKFIFDVDGTLTPSRDKINKEFKKWFLDFCITNDVYLVTGSDYQKTIEQVGEEICLRVNYVFNCSGNDVWSKGKNITTNKWTLPKQAREWFENALDESYFPLRTGNHIEERPGTVNFSILGRGASKKQRKIYIDWDLEKKEREFLSVEFNHQFHSLESRLGGETGIDIYPKGKDKSQILKYFDRDDKLYFFGDKCQAGGNDYPLAKKIKNSFQVRNWLDTWERLENFKEVRIVA